MSTMWNPKDIDYTKYWGSLADAGQKQATYNRPSTSGPFGSATVGADGSINSSFSGPFGQLNNSLMGQAANVAANPMDWGQFGTLGTGEDAGKQAANAAYSQSISRLNPFWAKSQNRLNTGLLQSGMGDSTAADNSQGEFGMARNDAYSGAMTNALGAGAQAQQQAFGGNLASRQNNVSNALRGQTQPFEDLAGMQGFLAQPEVGQDNSMLEAQAAHNSTAQTRAFSEGEQQFEDQVAQDGRFNDKPGEPPGTGERRKKWFESLPQEQRVEVILGQRGWEEA